MAARGRRHAGRTGGHVCTSSHAHRIQSAGRREPHRRPARPRAGAGYGRVRHHRPRRDVRRGGFLPAGAQARHSSGDRLRGICVPEHGGQVQRRARLQSPGSSVRNAAGLSEPDQAGERGLHARLLLQAPRGLRRAAPVFGRADRAVGMPVRRPSEGAARGASGAGGRAGAHVSGYFWEGSFLY